MSTTVTPTGRKPAPLKEGPRPRRWTREEFYRAAEHGVFRPDERLELLDGEIFTRMTQNPPHAALLSHAARLVVSAFGPGFSARQEKPLVLNGASEPLPDIVIVPGNPMDYLTHHPAATDACLVIEVSDTPVHFDRTRKRAAYARARVAEYWILNLRDRQLEVYREPVGGRYRTTLVYRPGDEVAPLAAPDAIVRVANLLPLSGPASS
jgi:Uma2 family endonuclease